MINKKIVICLLMFTVICTTGFSQAVGVVHDPVNTIPSVTQWLTSIEELYKL